MKIIHCSDLHLDSKMESNLDKEKARERKNEILITFENMVKYAKENDVQAIIIAGDLFDKKNVSVKAKRIVQNAVKSNPEIDFIYLKGNHDESGFIDEEDMTPENLKMFNQNDWTTYEYGNITITGIEFGKKDNYELYNSLMLPKNKFNIVVLHGQEAISDAKDKAEIINLKELKNKNIDYLALGHIHKYKQEKLDNRGIYCYSGCLEGRGFDECGEKGFVLLEIDEALKTTFIPFSQRKLHEVNVDITDIAEYSQIEAKILEKTKDISGKDLVKIVLTGKIELDANYDIKYFEKKFENNFYFLKIYDECTVKIDYMKYQYDATLKGEFIRRVQKEDISDEEKIKIITTGIKALSGEEF